MPARACYERDNNKENAMKKTIKNLFVGSLAVLLLSGVANADEIRKHNLRFAFVTALNHPIGHSAEKFAELVKTKSDGKMNVRVFAGGTLGGDIQTVSSVQGGTLDFTVLNAGLLSAQAKDTAIFDLPFLFNDSREALAIADGPLGQDLAGKLEKSALITLGYWDLGFRHLTNNKHPVTKWEDMQGLKIRVLQSPLYLEMIKALGANPMPMPFTELYTGLEQHVIDGQENPFSLIESAKLFEVQKYLSTTGHIYNVQSFIAGQKTWNKLNQSERQIILDAAHEATLFQRQASVDSQEKSLAFLKQHQQVNEITAEELERFREKVKPVVEAFSKEIDPATVELMNSELQKYRQTH